MKIELLKIKDLVSEGLAYNSGDYKKGDITPGEYAFIQYNSSRSYYCEKDASDNIIDNENFNAFGYAKVHGVGNVETRGFLINVTAFDELNVTGAKQIYEILNHQKDYNQSGFYTVGFDIKPGKYVVESIGAHGYYAIMTGPISSGSIVKNSNFNGTANIVLNEGQYVKINRAMITEQDEY